MLWLLNRERFLMNSGIFTRRLLIPPPHLVPLPLPSPREVHFSYVLPNEVKDVSLLKQYLDLLSPCERQKVLCINEDKIQKDALLARALVRTTLARYSRISPSSLKFRKNRFGKPEVEWQHDDERVTPSLHFNISHTSSLIACGVTLDVPVGIDVEEKQRKPKNSIIPFARRYFSPSEVEFLNAFSDPESQRREFIKLWTLKEAYVKALGRGFSAAPFRKFSILYESSKVEQGPVQARPGDVTTREPRVVVQVADDSEDLTTNWQFRLFELDGSHYAAVCVQRDDDIRGGESDGLRLKVRKTIPLVDDGCILDSMISELLAIRWDLIGNLSKVGVKGYFSYLNGGSYGFYWAGV